MTDVAELPLPELPAIVSRLDERFRPASVQVTQAEWAQWSSSNDEEVRARIQERLQPSAVPLTAREWPALRALLFEAMGPEAAQAAVALEQAPPYTIKIVPDPLGTLVWRFRSANTCPTDRIHIQRAEWTQIRPLVTAKYEADLKAYRAQEVGRKKERRATSA